MAYYIYLLANQYARERGLNPYGRTFILGNWNLVNFEPLKDDIILF